MHTSILRSEGQATPTGLDSIAKLPTNVNLQRDARIENIDCIHLQDPTNEKKRIYKVFKCIEDSAGTDVETGHALKGTARVSQNRAIHDAVGTVLTNKAAQFGRDPMQMQLALQDGSPDDAPSKNKRPKKEKKEPTEAEKKQRTFDSDMRKILS